MRSANCFTSGLAACCSASLPSSYSAMFERTAFSMNWRSWREIFPALAAAWAEAAPANPIEKSATRSVFRIGAWFMLTSWK